MGPTRGGEDEQKLCNRLEQEGPLRDLTSIPPCTSHTSIFVRWKVGSVLLDLEGCRQEQPTESPVQVLLPIQPPEPVFKMQAPSNYILTEHNIILYVSRYVSMHLDVGSILGWISY